MSKDYRNMIEVKGHEYSTGENLSLLFGITPIQKNEVIIK